MPYLTIGKWVGGVLLGLGLAWAIYAGIIRPTTKPNPTTTQNQQAAKIENTTYSYSPRVSFGCVRWDMKPLKQEIKQTAP